MKVKVKRLIQSWNSPAPISDGDLAHTQKIKRNKAITSFHIWIKLQVYNIMTQCVYCMVVN